MLAVILGIIAVIIVVIIALWWGGEFFMFRRKVYGGERDGLTYISASRDWGSDPTDRCMEYLHDWKKIEQIGPNMDHVDFCYGMGYAPDWLCRITTRLRNRLVDSEIANTANLHDNLRKVLPDAIAEGMRVHEDTTIDDGTIWMMSTNWGRDITKTGVGVVTTNAELRDFYDKNIRPPDDDVYEVGQIIASKYVVDPLLWEVGGKKYKFHAQVYVIVVCLRDRRYVVMLNEIPIVIAAKPYVAGDWNDLDVHLTHYRANDIKCYMDENPHEDERLRPITVKFLKRLFPELLKLVEIYPNTDNCYAMYALTILYTNDRKPMLMKILSAPNFSSCLRRFRMKIAKTIMYTAFNDVFYPQKKRGVMPDITYLVDIPWKEKELVRTYTMFVDQEFKDRVQPIIDQYLYDWKELPKGPNYEYVDFIFGANYVPISLRHTKARLKNGMEDIYEIADKEQLHKFLGENFPESIAKTILVDESTTIPNGSVYIVRANWGQSGNANAVVTTTKDLQEFYIKNKNPPADWKSPVIPRVILSEYITDPYLWNLDGKMHKFHARINILVFITPWRRCALMMRDIIIVVSAKPYVNGDYDNKDYHDTHMRYNPREIYMSDDPKVDFILRPTGVELLKEIFPDLINRLRPFREAISSYIRLGVDMMWDKNGKPIIIEINNKPSFSYHPSMQIKMFELTMSTVFNDTFYRSGYRGRSMEDEYITLHDRFQSQESLVDAAWTIM